MIYATTSNARAWFQLLLRDNPVVDIAIEHVVSFTVLARPGATLAFDAAPTIDSTGLLSCDPSTGYVGTAEFDVTAPLLSDGFE